MNLALAILIDGVSYGMVLFIISIGLSITMGLLRVINMAHGGFAMIGGFIAAFVMSRFGAGFEIASIVAVAVVAILSVPIERVLIRRVYSRDDLDPIRPRELLLHQREINELARATEERGVTIVPLRVYFKDGRAKVEIATARGKARHDKRQALAAADAKRDIDRALKGFRNG